MFRLIYPVLIRVMGIKTHRDKITGRRRLLAGDPDNTIHFRRLKHGPAFKKAAIDLFLNGFKRINAHSGLFKS